MSGRNAARGVHAWLIRRTRVVLMAGHTGESVNVSEPLSALPRTLRCEERKRARPIRRLLIVWAIVARFLTVIVASKAITEQHGPTLAWGKIRRALLSAVPPLARYLQRRYRLSGSCSNCGASCTIMFDCPFWESQTRLCSVYQDRPTLCRLFPITPSDVRDRDLAFRHVPCGFSFVQRPATEIAPTHSRTTRLAERGRFTLRRD